MRDLAFLELGRTAVHIVWKPRHQVKHRDPYLTDKIINLDDETKELLREKVVNLLGGSKTVSVIKKKGSTKSIVNNVQNLLQKDVNTSEYSREMVEISKKVASHYCQVIDGRSKDSLVILQEMALDEVIRHAIMILEFHEGIRAKPISNPDENIIDIEFIKGLVLSKQTRLFKIAYFPFIDGVDGIVCDTQSSSDKMVANFFINNFLNCRFIRLPQVATKNFFQVTQEFINSIEDSKDKYLMTIHLTSYLQSNENILNPRSFARLIEPKYAQKYINHLNSRDFPLESFQRDLSKISKQLEKKVIDFEIGVSLIGHPKRIEEKVKMERSMEKPGEVSVNFQSKIKKLV